MKRKPHNTKAYNTSKADYTADIKKESPIIPQSHSEKVYPCKTDYVFNHTRNGDTKQK